MQLVNESHNNISQGYYFKDNNRSINIVVFVSGDTFVSVSYEDSSCYKSTAFKLSKEESKKFSLKTTVQKMAEYIFKNSSAENVFEDAKRAVTK